MPDSVVAKRVRRQLGRSWPGEDSTRWREDSEPTVGQILHRLRTDEHWRVAFIQKALDNSRAAQRCLVRHGPTGEGGE